MLKFKWDVFRSWIFRNIGVLDDASLKHCSAILFISAIMLFTDPGVSLTLGSASLAGLGISVEPPQSIPVGLLLLALLMYRLVALWAYIILGSGTDENKVRYKTQISYGTSHDNIFEPNTIDELISQDTQNTIYKWSIRKVLWELLPPNLAALASIIKFVLHHLNI